MSLTYYPGATHGHVYAAKKREEVVFIGALTGCLATARVDSALPTISFAAHRLVMAQRKAAQWRQTWAFGDESRKAMRKEIRHDAQMAVAWMLRAQLALRAGFAA